MKKQLVSLEHLAQRLNDQSAPPACAHQFCVYPGLCTCHALLFHFMTNITVSAAMITVFQSQERLSLAPGKKSRFKCKSLTPGSITKGPCAAPSALAFLFLQDLRRSALLCVAQAVTLDRRMEAVRLGLRVQNANMSVYLLWHHSRKVLGIRE